MRKKIRRKKQHFSSSLFFFLILIITFFSLYLLDQSLRPTLQEISHLQGQNVSNQIIDASIEKILQETDPTSFLIEGENQSYTANTAAVNQFCSNLSREITTTLTNIPEKSIRIPLGAATKISFLAHIGPVIPYTLLPMGAAHVDYKTEFQSVGINQINYKIWLNISMEMKIVNPIFEESVLMERKIMLADLIFGGKVPEHYFQMRGLNEYLLTE